MIASFGDIVFDTGLAPDSARHRTEARYAEHPVVGAAPLLEKVGLQADEFRMPVRLRRFWAGAVIDVEAELQTLRQAEESGRVETLMLGDTVFGRYVLVSVETEITQMTGGRIDAANVQLTFREYN